MKKHVVILGSGSWGTAVGDILARAGHAVTLWSSTGHNFSALSEGRRHPKLPSLALHDNVTVTRSLTGALKEAEVVFIACGLSKGEGTCARDEIVDPFAAPRCDSQQGARVSVGQNVE